MANSLYVRASEQGVNQSETVLGAAAVVVLQMDVLLPGFLEVSICEECRPRLDRARDYFLIQVEAEQNELPSYSVGGLQVVVEVAQGVDQMQWKEAQTANELLGPVG